MALDLPAGHPCLRDSASVYEALGWFLANFTILENALKILLLRATGADLQAGYFLVVRMDATALAPKIRATLRQRRRFDDGLEKLLAEIKDVAKARNYLSHSALEFDDRYSEVRCIGFGDTLAGGVVPSRTYSVNHLKHLSHYVMAATSDILHATDCLLLGQTPATAGLAKAVFPQKAPVAGQFHQGIPHTLAQRPVAEAQERIAKKTREVQEHLARLSPDD